MAFFFSNGNLLNDIWILKGDAQAARNSPDPGKCDGTSLNFIALHSLFMIISWGILIQVGAFVARYLKHKGNIWYNAHRILVVSISTGLIHIEFLQFQLLKPPQWFL